MSSNRLEGSPRRERRSGTFSLSAAFRSSPKRASVLEPILPDPPDLLPTCLERIHYPVFDPQNPNHNPAAAIALPRSPPPRRHDLQVSSSESQRQGSWLEDFPRRSIHKARSGLLAIRASLLRLSSRENTDFSEAIIQDMSSEASRRERDHVRGHGHSNSTQEDLSFGVCLFRTSTSPWATTLDGADSNLVPRVESPLSLPLVNSISAPAELESYYYNNNTDDDPEPMNDRPVSMASEEPPSYRSIAESARYHRHSNDSNPRGNTNRELGTDTSNETHGCLTQPSPSVDWDELGSPASSFRYEDMIPCQRKKVSRFQGTGSSLSSSPISVVTQSETLFSQEHLPPNRDQPKNDYCGREDLTPTPSPPSEMVTIAFPGVYQALLDQWAGEMRDKSKNIPCAPLKIPECNPVAIAQARQTDGGEAEPSGKRHSFGLHMSLRTDQGFRERPDAVYRQNQMVFSAHSHETPISPDSHNSSTPYGRTIESLYDGSEYSNYALPGSSPTNITSPSYYSNDIWSPLESPIDEELLFSPFPRNEYYMADGKTSGVYPDQDDQPPVKVESRFYGDGSIHSGRGLDRTLSDRLRELTERIPTMGGSRSMRQDPRTGLGLSESTDESSVIRATGYEARRRG
ncbi:hypothetical protein N7509_005585 [Penicillium cosmopolitanum]|uniref:Uncharacterized protein n=1 Tax=Penicillium cosmopolitanum TaxID=1131564 RepID=A0A9X0BA88_9EURO|nr:uncharacterized protein N7509_005585 [Penicillium cosmopolitanum]KAJ5397472.1 hypothetical protein N7509_005585 [Penicillium cosmopolitanum]